MNRTASTSSILRISAAAALLLATWLPFQAAQANEGGGRGKSVFEEQCAEYHSVKQGKNKKGPSLFGVIGRTASSQDDYGSSEGMKGSGLTWTPDKLDSYLVYPRKMVSGTKMKYDGLSDSAARAELIQYLSHIN